MIRMPSSAAHRSSAPAEHLLLLHEQPRWGALMVLTICCLVAFAANWLLSITDASRTTLSSSDSLLLQQIAEELREESEAAATTTVAACRNTCRRASKPQLQKCLSMTQKCRAACDSRQCDRQCVVDKLPAVLECVHPHRRSIQQCAHQCNGTFALSGDASDNSDDHDIVRTTTTTTMPVIMESTLVV